MFDVKYDNFAVWLIYQLHIVLKHTVQKVFKDENLVLYWTLETL
jgi:hypothetical protein